MKKLSLILLSALAFLPLRAGKIVTDSLWSRTLGATVKYNVYLPDGHGKTERTYPVVYMLHGLSDDYTAWRVRGGMQTVTDELIGTGEAKPMVILENELLDFVSFLNTIVIYAVKEVNGLI